MNDCMKDFHPCLINENLAMELLLAMPSIQQIMLLMSWFVSCRLRCNSLSFLGDNKTGTAAAALGCKMEF